MLKYATFIIAGLGLSACSFTTASLVPSGGSIQAAGTLGESREFSSFASRRDLLTEIHGNPFSMNDHDFANHVTQILNTRNAETPTNFTTEPAPSADTAFRAVLVFNRAMPLNGSTLCAHPELLRSTPPRSGRIPFDMAFCNGSIQLHSVTGTLPAVSGPNDRRFRNALAVALNLAQPRNDAEIF